MNNKYYILLDVEMRWTPIEGGVHVLQMRKHLGYLVNDPITTDTDVRPSHWTMWKDVKTDEDV